MNGYSKMSTTMSSDLTLSPPMKQPAQDHQLNASPPHGQGHGHANPKPHGHGSPWDQEQRPGPGVVLSRTCSSASQRFRSASTNGSASTASAAIQGVMRRAFSLRKCSSVAHDGYWRIHDTADHEGHGVEQWDAIEEESEQQQQQVRKKRNKIIRACKRLFGL